MNNVEISLLNSISIASNSFVKDKLRELLATHILRDEFVEVDQDLKDALNNMKSKIYENSKAMSAETAKIINDNYLELMAK